jgi:HEAT repeat protein
MSRPSPESLMRALTQAGGHEARAPLRDRLRALGPAAVPALVEALAHDDPFARWEAVNLLGELAAPATAETVVEFALCEEEVHARWRSFWAVTRFDPAVTTPLLLAALRGRDATRRWRAALILSMLGRDDAGRVLRRGLHARDEWTQWEALSAVRALGLAGAEQEVAPFLEPERDRSLRQEAVLALGAIGSDDAVALLVGVLDDPEPEVRWRASMALARGGPRAPLDALRGQLARERDAGVARQLREDVARLEVTSGGAAAA